MKGRSGHRGDGSGTSRAEAPLESHALSSLSPIPPRLSPHCLPPAHKGSLACLNACSSGRTGLAHPSSFPYGHTYAHARMHTAHTHTVHMHTYHAHARCIYQVPRAQAHTPGSYTHTACAHHVHRARAYTRTSPVHTYITHMQEHSHTAYNPRTPHTHTPA